MSDLDNSRLESLEVGPLPVINHLFEQLGLDAILQRHLPPARRGRPEKLSAACAVRALLQNVMLSRLPLYAMPQWLTGFVPVHVATDLTAAQIKGFRVADNQTASIAQWDYNLLPIELADLQGMESNLELLGFEADALQKILHPEAGGGQTDPDDVPEPPDEAITQPGDLWILGDHRLLCGDSSKPEDVNYLLNGQPIHMANTDPPYNVKVEPRSNNAIAAGLSSFQGTTHHQQLDVERHPEKASPTHRKLRPKDRPLANDFMSDEEFDRLLDAWFGNIARVLLPGRGFCIWSGYANLGNYPPCLKKHELYFSQGIVWDKEHPVLTRKDFMGAFEIAFYGWREGAAHLYLGPNSATDLWHVKKVNPQSMVHLTEKPVQVNELAKALGRRDPYDLSFADEGTRQ